MAEEISIPTGDKKQCLVCVEEIDGEKRLHVIGPCDHVGVCSLCYLRLRQLMKEDTCVLCKAVMDKVMVCKAEDIRPFEEFQTWGDNAGPDYDWDEKSRMFLPKWYNRSFVQPLQELRCGIENCPRPHCKTQGTLEKHLREKHNRSLCKICLKHRKVFIMEQMRYTNTELQQHIVAGDPKLGQAGHPRCEFCKTRFYDATALHEHLVKEHYSCHLCEKQGILHKYYRDYTDLERHFRSDHYLCEEEECLNKKFVVFADEIDLRGHMLQMHPDKPIGRKIQLNFKIKRSNWDGTGDDEKEEEKKDDEVHEWSYEGEIGEQSESPEALAARREAVRRAARNGGMVGLPAPIPPPDSAEQFPSLSGQPVRQDTGWASLVNARQPRAEDFPALHGAGRRQRGGGGAGSSFRSAVEAYPTRAQEIAMSGTGGGEWCFDYPMPPDEQTCRGGGGSRRPPGIGNMKLKVDKKGGKKKQKGRTGGGAEAGGSESDSGAKKKGDHHATAYHPLTPHPQRKSVDAAATQPQSSSPPDVAAVAAEEFPLAPGMKARARDRQHLPSGVSNGMTLAQSIARQNHSTADAGVVNGGNSRSVVAELRELIGNEAFAEVKELSSWYRSGQMMSGEYFKAMQERLPADRFGELFEGLIGILPDEDKRREMLVLLAASRSVEAKAKPRTAGNNHSTRTSSASSGKIDSTPQRSKSSNTRAPTPGSAATYLTAMGSKTGGKMGSTGISIVRPSRTGGSDSSRKANANLSANPGPRSDSPPPGVPLRRRGIDDDKISDGGAGSTGIAGAGASWATQGGSGFRSNSAAGGVGNKGMTRLSRDDFPGLVANRTGGGAGGGMPSSSANGLGGGYSSRDGLAVAKGAAPAPANPRAQQQRAPTGEDFPGLPTPSAPMPGMGRVDWGTASGGARVGQTSRNGDIWSSVSGGGSGETNSTSGGGKGGKKKTKQKAEKNALKGMAFGFR